MHQLELSEQTLVNPALFIHMCHKITTRRGFGGLFYVDTLPFVLLKKYPQCFDASFIYDYKEQHCGSEEKNNTWQTCLKHAFVFFP